MASTTQKDTFTFRVNAELLEEYRQYCEENRLVASAEIRQFMKDALAHRMQKVVGK